MTTATFAAAASEVARRDPVMASLMERAGPFRLRSPRFDHFTFLTRSICYQQLAGPAAAAIHGRFAALYDGAMTPEAVLGTREARLRKTGLSRVKIASIRDLAAKVSGGTVPLRGIARLSDDAVIERLTQVRGIGRWTAEMFLIFKLLRLDVWPVDDYGVRKGWALAYGLPSPPSAKELGPLGERFRPYRTVVAWYCYRAVDLARRQPG